MNAGANPNIKNVAGETVLMQAAVACCHAAVKILLKHPQTDVSIEVCRYICVKVIGNYIVKHDTLKTEYIIKV